MRRGRKPFHSLKRMFDSFLRTVLSLLVLLFAHMCLTKPASANWRTWPSAYMIGLFRLTTAEDARNYLGINIGEPSGPADAAEVAMNDDYIYFAVGDNQWVRVAVEAVYDMVELESGDLFLLESGGSLIFEEN